MRDVPRKRDGRPGRSVERLVTARDTRGTFQNEKMLVLILMNMHRRAVAGMREYLDDRIGTVRLRGRHPDEATLSRPRLQPLSLVLIGPPPWVSDVIVVVPFLSSYVLSSSMFLWLLDQPRFVVGVNARTDECAHTRQVETDVGVAEKAR